MPGDLKYIQLVYSENDFNKLDEKRRLGESWKAAVKRWAEESK